MLLWIVVLLRSPWKKGMRPKVTEASCLKLRHSLYTLKVANFKGEAH